MCSKHISTEFYNQQLRQRLQSVLTRGEWEWLRRKICKQPRDYGAEDGDYTALMEFQFRAM
ncbi:hypothetical protein GCM10009000_044420 [Halobacterium noricense]|uniref:Transposase n=1 Tax=Haladaptatus pallidirubidus TaxID=1008152 RepID=A0AAV3UFD1_9EURY